MGKENKEKDLQHWQVRDLQNKIRMSQLTIIVGFLTVLITISGYFVDNWQSRELRTWELRTKNQTDIIRRMNVIATEIDELLGETLTALDTLSGDSAFANKYHLQQEWNTKKLSPTPNFELMFGKERLDVWQNISTQAIDLVNNNNPSDFPVFQESVRNFQRSLYQKINETREGMIKQNLK